MDSREIFSKIKLDKDKLITAAVDAFEVSKDDILIVKESNDWLSRNSKNIVFEYKGLLDDKDDDEYYGYHYYDIFFEKDELLEKFKIFQKELGKDVIVTLE